MVSNAVAVGTVFVHVVELTVAAAVGTVLVHVVHCWL